MLHSMTGFARESVETGIGTLTWEIRAVNHRYLDVQFKMPEDLRPKEQLFRQQAVRHSGAARSSARCIFAALSTSETELQLDTELVELIGHRISELTSQAAQRSGRNPIEILRWPGVVVQSRDRYRTAVRPRREPAGTTLDGHRQACAPARGSVSPRCSSRAAPISQRFRPRSADACPRYSTATRAKQKERIDKLERRGDPARLEVELALIAQKIDVDEELDRLDSHLVEIRDGLRDDKPVGRRLDFLMQELNREANTLGSKSADTETTRAAVDLKVLIEQMREQIQNVE